RGDRAGKPANPGSARTKSVRGTANPHLRGEDEREQSASPRRAARAVRRPDAADQRGLGRHDHRPGAARAGAHRRDPGGGGAVMSAGDAKAPQAAAAKTVPAGEAAASAEAGRCAQTPVGTLIGLLVVLALAAVTRVLDKNVPGWTEGTAFGE